jgi:hypothetical protein
VSDSDLTAPPDSKKTNQTEAPTSGQTLGAADLAKAAKNGLDDIEFDFVNIVHQFYRTDGLLLSAAVGTSEFGIPELQFLDLINRSHVKAALIARGIPEEKLITDTERWRQTALSAEQIFVADVMLDLTDTRSYKKKLQDLRISTGRWDAWLREPAFAEYLNKNSNQLLQNSQHEVALALMDKIRMGDLKAIQFHMEYTGRFVPRAAQTVGNENADLFNARQLINGLVDIIIDEVDDHDTAARIADRLKALIAKNSIVSALTKPEVIIPEVVPNRELTQKQKDLMDQGVGMET